MTEVSNLSKVTQMVCCKALRLLHLSYGPNHYCSFFDINNVNINEKVHVECLSMICVGLDIFLTFRKFYNLYFVFHYRNCSLTALLVLLLSP